MPYLYCVSHQIKAVLSDLWSLKLTLSEVGWGQAHVPSYPALPVDTGGSFDFSKSTES